MNRLTIEEISFFKREGYLIKCGVLDPDLMARARERKWKGAPPRMKRDDPSTWFGPFRDDEELDEKPNRRSGYTWKYMEPGSEEWIVGMLATDPKIFGWIEQLLGEGEVKRPDKIRGIYCRLPMGDAPEKPIVCHCDVSPDKLDLDLRETALQPGMGLVGLIAPIPSAGGSFTIWPGTHRIIYDLLANTEGQERIDAYKECLIRFNDDHRVEGCGEAGDILFWHRLLAHTAGWNRSAKIQLREAVLCDYNKEPNEELVAGRPYGDMWHEWSEEVRNAPV
jgi:hypothetical protein